MLIFNNLEEMESYYIAKINTYVFNDDITISFHLKVGANIDARYINAKNIYASDINALSINAYNIDALNILARDINARDIVYWGVCIARQSFRCKSVKGRRANSIHKCLDQAIEFIKKD